MAVSPSLQLPVQQRAWNTRERILAAAVSCLAEEGYAATTTSRIQARAEVSRGSLLHQFPSRDDLLIAAVQHLAEQRNRELNSGTDVEARSIDAAVDALWATFQGPLFRATVQLWAAAQHNLELAAELAPREHELGRGIRLTVARLFGPAHATKPAFGDFTALLISSMRGIALTYTFEERDAATEPYLALWRALAHQSLD